MAARLAHRSTRFGWSVLRPVAAAVMMLMVLSPTVVAKEPADVSGTWDFAFVDRLRTPAWVAQDILGIVPEGPMTQIICTGSGSMTLTQAGASFSGTYVQDSNQCVSKGGQVFQDPLTFVPLGVLGEINGSSLSMSSTGPRSTATTGPSSPTSIRAWRRRCRAADHASSRDTPSQTCPRVRPRPERA